MPCPFQASVATSACFLQLELKSALELAWLRYHTEEKAHEIADRVMQEWDKNGDKAIG